MIINFRARGISRGIRKLIHISMLIIIKKHQISHVIYKNKIKWWHVIFYFVQHMMLITSFIF